MEENELYLHISLLRFSFVTCFLFTDIVPLHSVAADILVLCVCLFLFSMDIIFCCIYRKCINHLISVNRGNEGDHRNDGD